MAPEVHGPWSFRIWLSSRKMCSIPTESWVLNIILTNFGQGKHGLIANASQKLQKHEKNYTPFLLGQQITF
jgi:hypothetical protein